MKAARATCGVVAIGAVPTWEVLGVNFLTTLLILSILSTWVK